MDRKTKTEKFKNSKISHIWFSEFFWTIIIVIIAYVSIHHYRAVKVILLHYTFLSIYSYDALCEGAIEEEEKNQEE